jgi:putative membrane-bound dehydrogenase-like protein
MQNEPTEPNLPHLSTLNPFPQTQYNHRPLNDAVASLSPKLEPLMRKWILALTLLIAPLSRADDKQTGAPLPPDEAVKAMKMPPGFKATVFAAEPDLTQPIGYCIDARGRLWVCENFSYPKGALTGKDRVVIYEDTDGDGKFDKKTLFAEGFGYLTSVQVGMGGVWVASAPNLTFFPMKEGDDKPSGPGEVVLTGWTWEGKHNVIDGLEWGPDGWLYGCHGITTPSYVGKPGTPKDQLTYVSCGIWRYHPTRKVFEYVVEGTCNPWGLDWDQYGEGFFTTSVVPHLYHVIFGSHYKRMFGHDLNPYIYEQLDTIADHRHWGTGDWTKGRAQNTENTSAGGGHSHAGAMIYYGDSWPAKYRGTIFMCNIHGNRMNNDILEQQGSGYVAHHGEDFMFANDKWFRGITIHAGPDGGVFVSDWSDSGECHQTNPDLMHGRIYKITYEGTKPTLNVDLHKNTDQELVNMQLVTNEWYARQARLILQERGPNPATHAALNQILTTDKDPIHQLRALWSLYITAGLDEPKLLSLLNHPNEHLRAWAIRLLCDTQAPSPAAITKFETLAKSDPSPFVRLWLASMAQRIPTEQRWGVVQALLSHPEDVSDHNLPLMDWYAAEALVPTDTKRIVTVMSPNQCKIPKVRELIARRLTVKSGATPKAEAK